MACPVEKAKHSARITQSWNDPVIREKRLSGAKTTQKRGIKKFVAQYTTQGDLVAEFPSIAEAARMTGLNHVDISRCACGTIRTHGGYTWRRFDNHPLLKIDPVRAKQSRKKAVFQFSLNGDFIRSYESTTEAGLLLNVNQSAISQALRGQGRTCQGYRFSYQQGVHDAAIFTPN